jgi:P-type Mg2+ transporter
MLEEDAAASEPTGRASAPAAQGLSSAEAEERLAQFGPNEPAPVRRRSTVARFFLLFANPLVIILLLAAIVAAFLAQVVDAAIIIVIVLLGNAINFAQTYRSETAVERLRERVAPTATVLRDGAWQEIPRRAVVPGDVVRLSAGDLVPADARLLASRDLFVQQAALTGESLPAEKEAQPAASGEGEGPEARNRVFLGTSVVSGTATAMVEATGPRTCFGDIAARLATRPEETEFERGLRRFGMLILRVVFFLVLFILAISLALRHNPFQSLLFAVALAVGLTPEFLPMITSVTLARGAVRMARKKVIVKNLAAIQNFGAIDIFCTDKTGTITGGEMAVDRALDSRGGPSDRAFLLAYLNSKFETGIRSPLDAAILRRDCPAAQGYEKRDEIPFDFERRRVSIVVAGGGEILLVTKGAPESILPLVAEWDENGQGRAFDAAARDAAKKVYEGLGRQGFRVLAIAWRRVEARPGFSVADEAGLTLAGFVSFSDPLLPESAEALADLKEDGVQVKILTGDNELVTAYVCERAGLGASEIVLGREVERMSDAALAHVAENTAVFARVSPAQKHRIIRALMHRGYVVGYMGDGINDAPSLHSADVGISVPTAVDVARDAADIIFVEPGLRVLHSGILEGRHASGNVMKYLFMGTSSNFGNMLSMAAASAFLPFLPMLPTQILLNNFLYDLAQITIPTDNVDEEYTRRPQRWDIGLIRNFMLYIGPISSLYDFFTFFVLLYVFHADEKLFHTGWFVESLATQTLVLFVIRTMGNPLRSRPSRALAATACAVVLAGLVIPFTWIARPMGFTPLPWRYFVFLAAATVTYLALVEVGKRWLIRGSRRAVPASP